MSQTIQNLVGVFKHLTSKNLPKLEGSSLVIQKQAACRLCLPTSGLDQGFEKILEREVRSVTQFSHPKMP